VIFNKRFEDITIDDINQLVNSKERESQKLDYKSEIDPSDRGKKEFAKDLCGFANADGGYIIIGVKEENGQPEAITGVEPKIGEQKIEDWIGNVIYSRITPPIRYTPKLLELPTGKALILLYIPQSERKPHMVIPECRYYIRHNTSVNPAGHAEVIALFEYSRHSREMFEEFLRLRNLLDENNEKFGVNRYTAKLTPGIPFEGTANEIPGEKKPYIIFSFVPRYLDENRVYTADRQFLDWVKHSVSTILDINDRIVNHNGILFYTGYNDRWLAYIEFLDNAFLEYSTARYFSKKEGIPILYFPSDIIKALLEFARIYYARIKYYDEVRFQISILNAAGYRLFLPRQNLYFIERQHPCRDDRIRIVKNLFANELSDEMIKEILIKIGQRIGRAFGRIIEPGEILEII
jgi:hypothetical protein